MIDSGADPGEVKWVNFHPPFSEPRSFFFFSYPSNIDWFQYIITKIHPPFQNPGSAPEIDVYFETIKTQNKRHRTPNNINRKPHRKVTKLRSKFSLILGYSGLIGLLTTGPTSSAFGLG